MSDPNDVREVEEDLALDMRTYGVCFWKFVDGRKVRVHPLDVRRGRDRIWRDSTNTPVEYNSVSAIRAQQQSAEDRSDETGATK
jgi:hypothetical protein